MSKEIPEGMKRQKVCHDDSCPPYDSYCSFCSASRNCYSEDFRIVPIAEPDEIHIRQIKEKQDKNDLYNQAIDDAIRQANDYYKEIKPYTRGGVPYISEPHFNQLISKLSQLKK